jgi:hypothetical protein
MGGGHGRSWTSMGAHGELTGEGKEERGRGCSLGATRGAARAALWEGLQALLTASCFMFFVTCCAWLVLAVRA